MHLTVMNYECDARNRLRRDTITLNGQAATRDYWYDNADNLFLSKDRREASRGSGFFEFVFHFQFALQHSFQIFSHSKCVPQNIEFASRLHQKCLTLFNLSDSGKVQPSRSLPIRTFSQHSDFLQRGTITTNSCRRHRESSRCADSKQISRQCHSMLTPHCVRRLVSRYGCPDLMACVARVFKFQVSVV